MNNLKRILFSFLAIFIIASCDEEPTMVDPNADLEVIDMVFSSDDLDRDNSVFSGTVEITGVIVNTGTTNFTSNSGQQQLILTEEPLGGSPSEKVNLPFTNVNAGDTIYISYSRSWYLANEFPPSFKVAITYDPDIFTDGNDDNDDKDLTNNSLTKTGYDIHDSF